MIHDNSYKYTFSSNLSEDIYVTSLVLFDKIDGTQNQIRPMVYPTVDQGNTIELRIRPISQDTIKVTINIEGYELGLSLSLNFAKYDYLIGLHATKHNTFRIPFFNLHLDNK